MRNYRRGLKARIKPRSAGTLFKTRRRLDWPPDRDFRILAIDGGGIRGILPLAVMAHLEEAYLAGASIASCFDLIAGTSTGGIIALGLGTGKTAAEILHLYMERGGEVFPDDIWLWKKVRNLSQTLLLNRCNRSKLRSMVDEILDDKRLWESKKRLCIPSAETRHFEPFIFKTPHHPDYRIDWSRQMADIAMATSAAPTFYPPVYGEEGYEFVDGGIWANNPIMVGVADAVACFGAERGRVKALSFGCVRDTFEMSVWRRLFGGKIFWASLIFETMHIASQNAVGQARLILGGDRVLRVEGEPITPPLELWDWAGCREKLPAMASRLFSEHADMIARNFLHSTAEPYEPFYTPDNPPPPAP
jgi:hypothetical protein